MSIGDGRGRWYRWRKKDTVESHLALSAHHVLARIVGNPGAVGVYSLSWQLRGDQTAGLWLTTDPARGGVVLSYSYAGAPVDPYLVRWVITTPNYGGRRYWWLCPACGRRCAILYGGKVFACRACHDLTYACAQDGDPMTGIDNRMLRIRRRLGAPNEPGWPGDPLPEKPARMHWTTYARLVHQYANLAELRDQAFTVGLCALAGWPADMGLSEAEARAFLAADMASFRRDPDHGGAAYRTRAGYDWRADPPERLTLGELAARAGVPFAFAKEAQQEGLLRPDAGRTKRAKRYRPRLAGWLSKLHALRAAGLSWGDLRAWTRRRFTSGHEHERQYPASYAPACSGGDPEAH